MNELLFAAGLIVNTISSAFKVTVSVVLFI